MSKLSPYVTQEQIDRVFATKPVYDGQFELDFEEAIEHAVYSYQYSNLARCHVELSKREQHLQSMIDNLMFEYCPDDMTKEQVENWSNRQRPASVEKTLMINKALGIKS